MSRDKRYLYCIFYLEKAYIERIPKDLKKRGYSKQIKSFVPTVNILQKVMHGKDVYRKVPLLFNYGFMRIPYKLVFSRDFMRKLKKDIPGIRGWVKSTETLHPRKKKKRIDNIDIFDDFSLIATVPKKEVKRFMKLSTENKKYSLSDLMNLNIGDFIILKGYPYDGLNATILDINHTTKTVMVELILPIGKMEVHLPFDQVIESVYHNYDPEDNDRTTRGEVNMSDITEEDILKTFYLKQY